MILLDIFKSRSKLYRLMHKIVDAFDNGSCILNLELIIIENQLLSPGNFLFIGKLNSNHIFGKYFSPDDS